MKNPILESFLAENENILLYNNYLENPTEELKNALEERFKKHVEIVRAFSYFSKILKFEAQRFDKKVRQYTSGSSPIENEEGQIISHTDLITVDHFSLPFSQENFEINFTDDKLSLAISKLSKKQREVIFYVFVKELTEKEAAKILNTSFQAVYKTKKKALDIIRENIETVEGEFYNG